MAVKQKHSPCEEKRASRRKIWWKVLFPVGALTFVGAGCEFAGLILQLLLLFMGASPDANFDENGRVGLNMVPINEFGEVQFLTNALYDVEVTNPPQTIASVDMVESKPAKEQGTFAVLLDSSTSMESNDPERQRVTATVELTREVLIQTPTSRMAVFDFGAGASGGFEETRALTPYTSDPAVLAEGTEKTIAEGWTPLYDSLVEVLGSMSTEIQATFQTTPVDKAIVVVSDGEDTSSSASLEEVISLSKQLDIPVHVIEVRQPSTP